MCGRRVEVGRRRCHDQGDRPRLGAKRRVSETEDTRPGDGFALWGGRFKSGGLAPEADALNRSLPVDGRLWREELEVAGAWAEALGEMGALERAAVRRLLDGLEGVRARLTVEAVLFNSYFTFRF